MHVVGGFNARVESWPLLTHLGSGKPPEISLKKNDFIYLLIFGCAGSLLLCGLFSSCGEQGLLSSCSTRASHCSGFSCCGAQALQCAGSVTVAHGLRCSMVCGIFLEQVLNPCRLHQ